MMARNKEAKKAYDREYHQRRKEKYVQYAILLILNLDVNTFV
jgi:hypothetical protein